MAKLGSLPSSHAVAETYAVVPSLALPRFLLPMGVRRGVATALSRRVSSQSPQARALGVVAGVAWRTGLGDRAARTRLTVGIDRRVPPEQWGEWLIVRHLGSVIEGTNLSAVIPVKRATPNSKPTARLLRSGGEVVGYAKLGWSDATHGLVANEARVLCELDGGVGKVSVPRVLANGEWQSLNYLVTSPLTDRHGRFLVPPDTMVADLLAISRSGDLETTRLQDSAYFRGLQSRLAAATGEPEVVTALSTWLSRVCDDVHLLSFGRWHGDWVSWNLSTSELGTVAWDWEYSARSAPLGFDLLHWHFQQRLARTDGSLAAAVAAVDAASPSLSSLGIPPRAHALLVSVYLIEVLTRAVSLASLGCGWNPRLYPDLLRLAASRDRSAG